MSTLLCTGHRNLPFVSQDAENQLKTEREEFAAKEQQFEKELATIQKLAALYKSNSDKRSAEAAELEGVVRDLRKHIQVPLRTIWSPFGDVGSMRFIYCFPRAGPLSRRNCAVLLWLVAGCCTRAAVCH